MGAVESHCSDNLASFPGSLPEKCEGGRDERRGEPGKYYHMLTVEATPFSVSHTYKKRVWPLS